MLLIINLLSTGPGTFVYHFLVLLVLEAIFGIVLVGWRDMEPAARRRALGVYGGLLGVRLFLLIAEPVGIAVIAPLLNGVEMASVALLGWAFLATAVRRRIGASYLAIGLGLSALCAITFMPVWYETVARVPNLFYMLYWQQTLWYGIGLLLALTPALLLWRFRRQERPWGEVGGFLMLALGFLILGLGSWILRGQADVSQYTLIAVGRIVQMVGYPLFAVAVHGAAVRSGPAARRPAREGGDEFPYHLHELRFLVELSRAVNESLDLDATLQRVAEGAAQALGADRCVIFLPGENQHLSLAAHYTAEGRLTSGRATLERVKVPLAGQPALAQALERRKQLVIGAAGGDPALRALYQALGSPRGGPTIIQPLLHHRRVLGVIVVGNDLSQRAFGPEEAQLCQDIAAQCSGSIENARLYTELKRVAAEGGAVV